MQTTDAMAFEAAAALDAYEEQLMDLRSWLADRRIACVQLELRRVCGHCMGLPQLSGATMALLLAHHRLLAELASRNVPQSDAPPAALADVQDCVIALRRQCRELFVAPRLH